MTTKNLSKPFKGKINGQRLPPIPIANEPPSVPTTNGNLPHSILKKSKPLLEEKSIDNHQLPLDDGKDHDYMKISSIGILFLSLDELDTARTIFQKSVQLSCSYLPITSLSDHKLMFFFYLIPIHLEVNHCYHLISVHIDFVSLQHGWFRNV